MTVGGDPGFGLYLHWPFCAAKCPYCDFNSHVSSAVDQEVWARALLWDLDRLAAETDGRLLRTIYFGGGTPSLMDPKLVGALLDRAQRLWPWVNDIEITLEANPSSVEAGRFRGYRAAGVNRVSLGVQALRDGDLKALGRLHSVAEARTAIGIAQDVFDRVSFDLIYARQHQTPQDWAAELAEALRFGTDHLSLYQLTIESGTVFEKRQAAGHLRGLPDEDWAVEMFEITRELTDQAGRPAYEVSNHAAPGDESRHNLGYWRGLDYLGVGPGAHGRLTLGGQCWTTEEVSAPQAWLDRVSRETSPEKPRVALSGLERADEVLMMGLRLSEGVDLAALERQRGAAYPRDKISALAADGLLVLDGNRLGATDAGRLLLNAVLRALLVDA